jgi:hypothetical protein
MAVNHQNLPEGYVILLEDRFYNITTDITKEDSNYKVQIGNEIATISNRFYLHVLNSSALNTEDFTISNITFYTDKLNLIIKGIETKSVISIYNLLGQEVFKKLVFKDEIIDLSGNLNHGNYIVKVTSEKSSITKKVFLFK